MIRWLVGADRKLSRWLKFEAAQTLQGFAGTLVSDDFSGYHALQSQGVRAALCMAHARRKLFEAHQFNASPIAAQAVTLIAKLYEIEGEARELQPDARWRLRQRHAKPVADALHVWLRGCRRNDLRCQASCEDTRFGQPDPGQRCPV